MSRDDYIRVSARVRNTRSADEKVVFADESTGSISFRINGEEKRFTFDNVFNESSSQEGVFVQVGKRIIDGCLAGYNGTIFAYGQTGSGKTYTMFGPQNEDGSFKKSVQGVIPRCMDYLFEKLNSECQEDPQRFSFTVNCSFVQLYNESIFCLLDKSEKSLRIRKNAKNEVVVDGAVVEHVTSCDEVFEILRIGFKNRRVAETSMNRESSRSHAIFMVDIRTQHVSDGVINSRCARLNLVDLAGSERQSDSQTTGSHLKEATYINKSLSTLTRVIRSLSKKPNEYPGYRDSSLTRLLQDSLGGNTRSSVIINLHPIIQYTDTTASTLYFSDTVKRIKNNATVNENIAGENVDALKNEILRLKSHIDELKCSTSQLKALEDELYNVKKVLTEKDERIMQLEICVENQKNTISCLESSNLTSNHSKEMPENNYDELTTTKLYATEQKMMVAEKRAIEAEKSCANVKNMLKKREHDIVEYESCLTYKAKRLDNIRAVLDDMQKRATTLEDENARLKEEADFQKMHFEKEKIEFAKKTEQVSQTRLHAMETKLEEMEAKLKNEQMLHKEAVQRLAEVSGHQNTKQKINYVNNLREKVAILENENAKLLQENAAYRTSMSSLTNENSRKRPALRSRGNSQPRVKAPNNAK